MPTNVNNEEFRLKAVDEVTPVVNQVKRSFSELNAGLDTVKNALGAVGVTVGAGAMVKLYADVVHATAALDDMAESTGASVENLSKLEQVAKIGGHEFEGLTGQIGKMIKGLASQDEEGKKAGKALAALGVSAKDTNGFFRDTGEILIDVAKKLGQYEDNGNKVALVQDLLGKGAERYLPFLKDLAEEGSVQAKVTAQQAAEAEKLEKNINRLKIAFDETKRSLVLELTPTLVDFTEKLLAAVKAAGTLGGGLLTMMTAGTENPRARIQEIDKELAARRQAQQGMFADVPIVGVNNSWATMQAGRLAAEREYLLAIERQRALSRGGPGALDARDLMAQGKGALNYESPATGGSKATGPSLADLLNQSAGVDKDFTRDLGILHKGYTDGKVTLEQYQAAVVALIEKQEFARKASQLQEQTNKALMASEEALAKVRDKQRATLADLDQTQRDMVKKAEMEADAVGRTSAQVEKANALREADIALRKALAELATEDIGVQGQLTAELIAQNEAVKERISKSYDLKAAKEAALEVTKKQQEEQKRLAENIERSLTDAVIDGLMNGFDKGYSFAQNFLRTLKNLFKTAILEPLIRPMIAPVSGFMSGVGQNLAGSFFGGSGGGMGGIGNLFSASKLFGGDTGFAARLGGLTGGAGLTGTLMADSIMAEMVGGATAGASASAIGAGALSGLGPYGLAAGAALALFGGDLFGGGGGDHNDPRWDPRAEENNRTNAPPGFDAAAYLAANPDVAGSVYASHPWDHYNVWGKEEGRKLQPDDWAQQLAAKAMQEAAASIEKLVDQEKQINDQIGSLVKALPDRLGITALSSFQDSLATSEYVSPLDRLSGAKRIYQDALDRARAGDLDAVKAVPGAASQLLGIGRDVYASGSAFQDIFSTVNSDVAGLKAAQQDAFEQMTRELPAAVMQGSQDTVAALKTGFGQLVERLTSLETEITRLRAVAGGAA